MVQRGPAVAAARAWQRHGLATVHVCRSGPNTSSTNFLNKNAQNSRSEGCRKFAMHLQYVPYPHLQPATKPDAAVAAVSCASTVVPGLSRMQTPVTILRDLPLSVMACSMRMQPIDSIKSRAPLDDHADSLNKKYCTFQRCRSGGHVEARDSLSKYRFTSFDLHSFPFPSIRYDKACKSSGARIGKFLSGAGGAWRLLFEARQRCH